MARNLMICRNSQKSLTLNESEKSVGRYILEGVFATLGKKNRNDRIYSKEEYLKHLQYLRDDIKKGETLFGELDHPEDRFEVKVKEASHRIIDLWYDEANNTIMGKIELLNTPNGKIAQSLVDQGIPLCISSRAAGSVNGDNTVNIQQIYTYDLVAKPGFAEAVLHRVNESAESNKYTEDVRNFLTESEAKAANNSATQFGLLNEEVSIIEVPSEIKLRSEAMEIKEEENVAINDSEKTVIEDVVAEGDDQENTDDASADENNDDTENDGDENKSDDDDKKDDIEIIDIEVETTSDDEDDEDKDDADSEGDGDASDDSDKEGDETSDEDSSDEKDDETKTDECDGATVECGGSDKSECGDKKDDEESKHDPKKEMILDCGPAERKKKFEDKFAELEDEIKKKNESKKTNESNTINKYPTSKLLNESNFAEFMNLDDSKKNKVMSYLKDRNFVSIDAVNENWRNGIEYEPANEVWLTCAPKDYLELYESAPDDVKESIKNTASFILFENQYDVIHFWESTGLMERSKNNLIHESFIANMPKIADDTKETSLPYGQSFIDSITKMACEYNN